MNFEFNGKIFETKVWKSDVGNIGSIVAYDSETSLIENGQPPHFILGQAYAGGDIVYLIQKKNLLDFFNKHSSSMLVMHNSSFDTSVVTNEVNYDFHDHITNDKLLDVAILYQLSKLASEGVVPHRWSLKQITEELLKVTLNKSDEVRENFGRYRVGEIFFYNHISKAELQYAATDAIATYQIFHKLYMRVQELDPAQLLSHRITLMGAIALQKVSQAGIGFDLKEKDHFLSSIEQDIVENLNELASFGYVPGQKGVKGAYENIIQSIGINLPTTASGMVSSKKDELENYRYEPFIDAYLNYHENHKLKSFIHNLNQERVHTSFNFLLNTGRTSSRSPNIQNLPRKPGIRECFIPSTNHKFLIIDYSTLELCTLAQVTFDRFGFSKMRELLNCGRDLHRWFASVMKEKPENEITTKERQAAKAANFGFPGGLGIDSFINFALKSYGVVINREQATALKEQWLAAFPEMRLYLRDSLHEKHDFSKSSSWSKDPEIACGLFKRIISGERNSKAGKPYSKNILDWAFKTVMSDVAPHFQNISMGSFELKHAILREEIQTRTGRIRGQCTYCQARNTPFQGLAADGAKIALYNLTRAGFKVVNFIHDEFIIEISESSEELHFQLAAEVEKIVVDSMKSVVPDVLIKAEWSIKERWSK